MGEEERRVIVVGAGGHAKTVLAIIETAGEYGVAGLLDDDPTKVGTVHYGYRVLGDAGAIPNMKALGISRAIVAIGDNHQRLSWAERLKESGFELISAVHPSVVLLRGSRVGPGTVIMANAHIGSDAAIGENGIVGVSVVVGHDARVGKCSLLCPGVLLGGGARVGELAFLGMGAVVLPETSVGSEARIGANAVVVCDLPDGVTAVGVPARILEPGHTLPAT
jgi:UDP-perosamine 4-acetyltransferase